jgi:hypothetical protein
LWVGGPVPRGSAAITLGRLVIVRRGAVTSRLLRHEEVHVRQFRQVGPIRFITSYLVHYVRWRARGYSHSAAYRRIPLEVEAYWLERSEGHDASSSE